MSSDSDLSAKSVEETELEEGAKTYSAWFALITVATFMTSFSIMIGTKFTLWAGLFIPLLLAVAATEVPEGRDIERIAKVRAFAITSTVILGSVPLAFAFFARRGHSWPFVLGVLLYGIDALLYLITFQLASVAVHLLGIFLMARGAICCHKLKKLRELNSFEPDYSE